jgi:hypothetical protein
MCLVAFFMPLLPSETFFPKSGKKPGRSGKLHYGRIDTETQGDNFILIFWVNTRIINLDYGREKVDAVFCAAAAVYVYSSTLIPGKS